MNRRDDVVREAVELVRSEGPNALTSVNVARRLGVTQSAIYRHVRDMGELATIASQEIVGELTAILESVLVDPAIEWGAEDDMTRMSVRLAATIEQHEQAFEVVDRWRFAPGALGSGIRELLSAGTAMIAELLSSEWARIFDDHQPFDRSEQTVVDTHAVLVRDDVIAVARARRSGQRVRDEGDTAELLRLRLTAGWLAFATDINERRGLAAPALEFS